MARLPAEKTIAPAGTIEKANNGQKREQQPPGSPKLYHSLIVPKPERQLSFINNRSFLIQFLNLACCFSRLF
jgi:hypothetical protein